MDPYVSLSFRQIHVVVYGTTSNYLTFRINFIIFLRTPCMNRARTKLLITLGKIVISIYRSPHGAEPNFTSSKGKAYRVRVAPPHGLSGTPLKGECVLCCIFTYKWDRS